MKQEIKVFDYAKEIVSAIPKGVLLTTKNGDKVDIMTIGWGGIRDCLPHLRLLGGIPVSRFPNAVPAHFPHTAEAVQVIADRHMVALHIQEQLFDDTHGVQRCSLTDIGVLLGLGQRPVQNKEIEVFDYAKEIVSAIPKGVLLTTKNGDKVDIMTIGWGTLGVEWGLPIFVAFVREGRFTREQLDASQEFTVNVPYGEFDKYILGYCGSKSGNITRV